MPHYTRSGRSCLPKVSIVLHMMLPNWIGLFRPPCTTCSTVMLPSYEAFDKINALNQFRSGALVSYCFNSQLTCNICWDLQAFAPWKVKLLGSIYSCSFIIHFFSSQEVKRKYFCHLRHYCDRLHDWLYSNYSFVCLFEAATPCGNTIKPWWDQIQTKCSSQA